MGSIVGFDLSTRKVGVGLVSLDGKYEASWTWSPTASPSPQDRVHEWCVSGRFRGSWMDDIAQVVIEWPMGKDPSVNTWIGAMLGGTLARVPSSMSTLIVTPQEWRRWLGWPTMKRAEAKKQAIRYAAEHTGRVLPEDEAEAVCMCLAALAELNRQADAA